MVRALRVDEVVFTGHVDDDELMAFYGVADAFLCLSEHEGFCVPLLEAMMFGIPVLAYDAGAVAETLRGGGILLREKRPEVVAELIGRVQEDAALRSAVLRTQERALAAVRAIDFSALLQERLAPVLAAPVVGR
jgi:glycosyltransferase involved in cell wall biosynthesis